jgi:integrase
MGRSNKLSATKVGRTKGPAILHDGGGLYLRIAASGAKSWVYRYALNGKRHDMGIGPYPLYSLAEARQKALEHRKLRHEGIDPLEQRRSQRAAQRLVEARTKTFRECAEDYFNSNKAGWRNTRHRDQWWTSLETHVFPTIGELPVQAIDTALVMRVLKPFWTKKPETASRVRGRIETVLDAAKALGFREGENPARWRSHLENLLPRKNRLRRVEHHAALPYSEVPEFFAALQGHGGIPAYAIQFAILTAARSGEVLRAVWGEIDLDAKVWTVPANRMKGHREHRVPLSTVAIAVLKAVTPLAPTKNRAPLPHAPVFSGRRRGLPMWDVTLRNTAKRVWRGDFTIHGFRSCFSDWSAERTAYPREVVEMALAHAIKSRVEAAYRRGDLFEKRRQLMDAWAKFCTTPPPASGAIVPLRAGR